MKSILIALRTALVLMLLCGLVYPLFTTGMAQLLFPKKAEGSLITKNGKMLGSELIAQRFEGPEWFHSRESAADYNPKASAGTNAAVASNQYVDHEEKVISGMRKVNNFTGNSVPADFVSASGSGLDPDISPETAKVQVPRIAKARGLSTTQVFSLIQKHTKERSLGIFGEPRLNVLELNLALQKIK